MKRNQLLDRTIEIFGVFSFLSLVAFFLAGHDIWHDYASPEVWTRAGQALPGWYSPVNRCPLEWGVLQAGYLLMLTFHVLLLIRFLKRNKTTSNRSET